MTKWYNINASTEVPIVTIYGYLVDSKYNPDDVTFASFIEDIDYVANTKPKEIIIKLNTGGGNVDTGFAIYDHIENNIKPRGITIITENVGLAASMGSIIYMVGDKRGMSANSRVMIHKPKGGIYGDSDEMTAYLELLKSYEEQAVEVYMKSGQTKEVVLTWLKSGVDKWITAKESLKLGLATYIIGGEKTTMTMKFTSEQDAWENHYQKINLLITKTNTKMAFTKEFLASLGLTEDATETQIQEAVAKMQQNNVASAKAVEDAKAQAAAAVQMSIKNLIDGAISSKKITESQRSAIEIMAKADIEVAKKYLDDIKAPVLPITHMKLGANASGTDEARKDWDYKMWMKNDSAGLLKMKTNNPDEHAKLLEAHKANVRGKINIGNGTR